MDEKKTQLSLTNFECAQIFSLVHYHLFGGDDPIIEPMILRTLELIFQDLLINVFSDLEMEVIHD